LASGSLEHSQQALEKAQTAYQQAWTYLVLARKSHPESAAMLEEEIRGLEAKLAAIESRLRQV
jgi:multidrug resistance efflux pump